MNKKQSMRDIKATVAIGDMISKMRKPNAYEFKDDDYWICPDTGIRCLKKRIEKYTWGYAPHPITKKYYSYNGKKRPDGSPIWEEGHGQTG